jgi:hypothetical protein
MNIPNKHPADALLALKAQIANLESLAKVEHARLVAMGEGAYEGEIARASVSIVEREKIDWKTIAEKLEPSRQLITAHTSTTTFPMVRVVARLG